MLIRLATAIVGALFLVSCSGAGNVESEKKPASASPAATAPSSFAEPQPVKAVFDAQQVARGENLYIKNCEKCHGKKCGGRPLLAA